jgi:hypothetical protein
VEDKTVTISHYKERKKYRLVRMCSYRNVKHSDSVYNRKKKIWEQAPPGCDSLLLVSKLVSQEAAQVLYGLNRFEFQHSAALQSFLECIGTSRQHLRHIALIGQGVLYRYKWAAMDASLNLLLQAKGLRSLEISHLDFCRGVYTPKAQCWDGGLETLVTHCKPLLESLKESFGAQNLDITIFEVIKIALPPCKAGIRYFKHHDHGRSGCDRTFGVNSRNNSLTKPIATRYVACKCACELAMQNNDELVRALREETKKKLGVEDGAQRLEQDE